MIKPVEYDGLKWRALTRALARAPKDFRRAIWQAYLRRKKQKGE